MSQSSTPVIDCDELAYAWSCPRTRARFKQQPEDFYVEEVLTFEPDGQGEHVCLLIEKTRLSTPDAVRLLARHFRVLPRDISYAGLKDTFAVTRQWVSLRVGLKRDLPSLEAPIPGLSILKQIRNSRKIRRGSHRGNFFRIWLRDLQGPQTDLEQRLFAVAGQGVPNYFGPQRFGRGGGNVAQALALFRGELKTRDRFLRGILLSAARAWLFNYHLSQRVQAASWNNYLPGDVLALDGSGATFLPEQWDQSLQTRLQELDIHPSGPLWGRGEPGSTDAVQRQELELAAAFPEFCQGLQAQGLQQERRALRLKVNNLQINGCHIESIVNGAEPKAHKGLPYDPAATVIEFSLAKGAYATSVLRELVRVEN